MILPCLKNEKKNHKQHLRPRKRGIGQYTKKCENNEASKISLESIKDLQQNKNVIIPKMFF